MRKVLAWFGLFCGLIGVAVFGAIALGIGGARPGGDPTGPVLVTVLSGVIVLIAVIDLIILRNRTGADRTLRGRRRGDR